MNVLILTPDRVGSTLLQRLLTVYMQRKDFGKPVINLHELTNGLVKYYNDSFQQDMLGKPQGTAWGYFQSLPEITDMLASVDHYKTSRLAQYHINARSDSIDDQMKFYEYLNNNFYIISCRRKNLLEHGLSWAIHAHSKKLNVYSPQEKINTFKDIYKDGITVSQEGFKGHLYKYVDYVKWSDQHFNVQSYFDYDTHINNVEDYILNLDFMRGHENCHWDQMFKQNFSDWNACHRLLPNLFLRQENRLLKLDHTAKPWIEHSGNNTMLPANLQSVAVTEQEHKFLSEQLPAYSNTIQHMNDLQKQRVLVTGIPLKLQSLQEKKQLIRNFDQCVEWYNQWVDKNNFGEHYSVNEINLLAIAEEQTLTAPICQQITHVV
jgi:hypothetical protein